MPRWPSSSSRALMAQQAASDKAVDPVCGMTVVKANAKATFDYKGATYYFCSTGCKEAFAKEPEKYLKAQQAKAGEATAPATDGAHGHDARPGDAGGQDRPGPAHDRLPGPVRHDDRRRHDAPRDADGRQDGPDAYGPRPHGRPRHGHGPALRSCTATRSR
ncbi:MAG: YHS domain-containing protein [Comamonadaceae bacterium]|nr:YHS domain-containing protein [Comamonadaceae bacterium]